MWARSSTPTKAREATPTMTITPHDNTLYRSPPPDRPTGWWDAIMRVWNTLEPALYQESWKPWIRIMLTVCWCSRPWSSGTSSVAPGHLG